MCIKYNLAYILPTAYPAVYIINALLYPFQKKPIDSTTKNLTPAQKSVNNIEAFCRVQRCASCMYHELCSSHKRIRKQHAIIGLTDVQIFGPENIATEADCAVENHCVPR